MEEELIKQIIQIHKTYNYNLEESTKDVLRSKQGRQAMQEVCNMFNISPNEYVKYLTNLAQDRLNKGELWRMQRLINT